MSDIAERFSAELDKMVSDYQERGLSVEDAITEIKGMLDRLEENEEGLQQQD